MQVVQKKKELLLGTIVLIGFLCANAFVAHRQTTKLHENAAAVTHTQNVLMSLERLMATITTAETGQRGYLITGDRRYLEPYNFALTTHSQVFDALRKLTVDNKVQQERLPQLERLIDARLQMLARGVRLLETEGLEAARNFIRENQGKGLMAQIRDLIDDMQQHEQELLVLRDRANTEAYRTALLSSLLAVLLGLVAVAAFVWLLNRHLIAVQESAARVYEQRELLQATLISIGDAVIATDAQGQITFMNLVAQSLTGWKQEDAHGLPLEKVFCIVNELSRQAVESPAVRSIREGKIVGLANHTILVSRDGKEWPIDDSAAPIRTADGDINGAILVFREVAERKRQEEDLRRQTESLREAKRRQDELMSSLQQSESQFRTLADSIPQLAWMTRPDGYILWYNKRWYDYTGTTFEEMQGWGWQAVHDTDELPRVLRTWKAALASGEPWEDHFPLRRRDGTLRWHLSRAVPVRGDRGQIVGWFGTNTDVTEHLQFEESLREVNRRKDEFLAMLAHELRNPLAPISNALQVWPLVENDREQMEQLREIMERQVQQMTRLIDDLLDVSRITRGKIKLRTQRIDLATVISSAIETVQPLIAAGGHQLTVSIPKEPILVNGDVARLTQVFGNILHNAAKYVGRNGVIRVAAEQRDRHAVVTIEDNGPGIPANMLSRIFEMFQQVEQTLDRSHGGLGIGLTLVKHLIDLHGGQVEARSEGPGQGSTFIVTLPISATESESTDGRTDSSMTTSVPRLQILVVDDVQASAKTLAMMLRSIGQQVTVIHEGLRAVDWVLAHRPDLVFLDIAMPGMDGYEVARRIRRHDELKGTFLVALTGYGQEEDRRRAIEAGFNHHMTKPTSIEALEQLLRTRPDSIRSQDAEAAPST